MENIYYFCAVFGSLFVVVQFILTLFTGFGTDDADIAGTDDIPSDGDFETDHSDAGISFFRLLSLRTVTAGIAFFGLIGMGATKGGLTPLLAFLAAFLAGFAALILVYILYRFINAFRYNGAVNSDTLPGSAGNVYLRIPAKREGAGKVLVNHQGRSMEYEAYTDEENELKSGTPITVQKILAPNQVLVVSADSHKQLES